MRPDVKLAIVVTEFNHDITGKMLKQALKRSSELKALITHVCKVPGSYDMPIMIQTLLENRNVDGIVTLGAIVRGETKHDEIIAHALATKMAELSLEYRKPVALGVAGPGMTLRQAKARAKEYANRSVESAVLMVLRLREAKRQIKNPSYPLVIE
jgi:6,7-dimethyl-8-ribityllumazine synthase